MDRRAFQKLLLGGGIGSTLLFNNSYLLAKSFDGMNPADYLKLPSNLHTVFDRIKNTLEENKLLPMS